jgi:chloramphenicol-sensitive protein RarD
MIQAIAIGGVPLVALALAGSFGTYGVVRKKVAVDAQAGLFIECLILSPAALAFIARQAHAGQATFFQSPVAPQALIGSGFITALPLALFAWGARRMPLSAMGFLQFVSPTISFVIGVAQGETFTPLRAASFVLIWAGAAVFITGAWRAARQARAA